MKKFLINGIMALSVGACSNSKSESDKPKYTNSKNNLVLGEWIWVTQPRVSEYSSARVKFFKPDGSPFENLQMTELEPWMKVHGHGTATDELSYKYNSELKAFEVTGLFFVMSGPWEINMTVTDGQITDSFEFPVQVP